ncbi:DUF1566 domain-containing protein [Motiliproteus sp. MSK22-1]|uniref:Lcl domain-containing protein n=1 Tax=Motiliproteus sp. MSK22-1 TaxID=1897630 RepID=UPI0009768602|nr:DUF1566 domain-containing protein [Motiliproteus sp. MSK22-1]OMH26639.1 hypothetical protein BGP75_23375 [Motiliproteus sp. MSK22-1]
MSNSQSYTIVDTGQSTYYDADSVISAPGINDSFFGQDAHYQGAQASYQDNGDGTVSDLNTGLMWQQQYAGDITYKEAVSGAADLSLAGYSDWRLPTIKELYSLMDFSGYTGASASNSNPYLDTDYFDFEYGDTSSGDRFIDAQYWSSTEYVSTTMGGDSTTFGVNFADGRIKGYPNGETFGPEIERYVRYVRGNDDYGDNYFIDNHDGTISDQSTDLTWLQADSGEALSWEDALAWAENLEYGGYSDWRLPNAKELQSILDYSRSPDSSSSAAIDPIFEVTDIGTQDNVEYGYYWSSTTHVEGGSGDHAVYLAFGRALGWMEEGNSYSLLDVHGAGAQRSDPKTGDPDEYPYGFGPQGDVIRIYNYVRAVRDSESSDVDTDDPDTYDNTVTGTDDNDSWMAGSGNTRFEGGNGTDTVIFSQSKEDYQITVSDNLIVVSGTEDIAAEGMSTLVDIERLYFDDLACAFDDDGVAGQAYRLYKAALNRTPDSEGLGYWIDALDNRLSLHEVADSFIQSSEFQERYGVDISNETFLDSLYNNVLGRSPDSSGYQWWLNVLNSGSDTREGVLIGFSESAENTVNVSDLISSGITYDLWIS